MQSPRNCTEIALFFVSCTATGYQATLHVWCACKKHLTTGKLQPGFWLNNALPQRDRATMCGHLLVASCTATSCCCMMLPDSILRSFPTGMTAAQRHPLGKMSIIDATKQCTASLDSALTDCYPTVLCYMQQERLELIINVITATIVVQCINASSKNAAAAMQDQSHACA